MGTISKILSKVNKAKSAINSLKGIGSKLQSLGFENQIDRLGDQATAAQEVLANRRTSLERSITASNKRKLTAKETPSGTDIELKYPLNDALSNYIVFTTRKRMKREQNIFSDKVVEIQLYVPDGLTSDSAVTYDQQGVGRVARQVSNAIDVMKDKGVLSDEALKSGKGAALSVMGEIVRGVSGLTQGGLDDIKQGRAVNPMKEQMLGGVEFREFSFDYEFWPKSEDEANMVNKIIYTFRTAMLPDTTTVKLGDSDETDVDNYFNFPNIFDVEFDGPIKDKIDGFLPMVCTACTVDHFNGGKVATFANGQPVSTSMKLSFVELKILSQESYQEISPFGNKGVAGDQAKHAQADRDTTDPTG